MRRRRHHRLVSMLVLLMAGAVVLPAGGAAASIRTGGDQLWLSLYSGPANGLDSASAVAVSTDGAKVFVAGQSDGGASGNDYATVAYDSVSGDELWSARYNGPGNGGDSAIRIALTPDGSRVIVTGSSYRSPGNSDYATVAYDAATGAQLWTNRYNAPGTSDDEVTSMALSPDGSKVFVTGMSTGKTSFDDYATIALDAGTGSPLWLARYNGPGNGVDTAESIAASPDGARVYVTGISQGATSGDDYATVAYAAATGAVLWAKRYTTPGADYDHALALAASPDGSRVFVTGWISGAGGDYGTVAYAATTGRRLWVARYDGGYGVDEASEIVVSPDSSKVFVSGFVSSPTVWDYGTLAYSAATGKQAWVATYAGPGNSYDLPKSIGVSPDGSSVLVTGDSTGIGGDYDMATVEYIATTGAQSWATRYESPAEGSDVGEALVVSPDGSKVFVTGGASLGPGQGAYATIAYEA